MIPPMKQAYALLAEKAKEAYGKLASMKPLVYDKPITFRVEVVERNAVPNPYAKPYLKIIDGRTYEVTADTMEEALFRHY